MGIKYSIRIYKKKKTLPNKMKFAFSLLALAVHADDDIVEDDVWQGAGTANAAAVGPRSGAGGVLDADRRYDDLTDIAKKHWQKSVREKHGDGCIGEAVRYTWKYSSKQSDFVSPNAAGSCERELFECDVQFVKDTLANKDYFNEDYHAFWSSTGFDHESDSDCPSGGSVPIEHECCGGVDAPWYWIGMNNNKCCNQGPDSSGTVVGINDQC